ncbi:Arc family DNA-binding protein [Pseudaminobacter soli (ex Li et al. 2025)]|uniref:Arc family DNA-binding protein n=1 Tax=Pseudaminobacter soli (ex Li et al. 2025) TaxID=1295366 RepID=UPI0015E65810|nr:Arc family DNA-binding protein [Mesorhizobium soli]
MTATRSKPDQYLLRLPPGLRERIKAYADYMGRSMNEEIVRILERQFPEPWVAGSRIDELLEMLRVLQRSGASEDGIAKLVSELKATIEGIHSGRVTGLDEKARNRIEQQYQEWQEREYEYQQDLASEEYDPIEDESLGRTGRPEKFVYPDGSIGPQREYRPASWGEEPQGDPFEDPFEDKK